VYTAYCVTSKNLYFYLTKPPIETGSWRKTYLAKQTTLATQNNCSLAFTTIFASCIIPYYDRCRIKHSATKIKAKSRNTNTQLLYFTCNVEFKCIVIMSTCINKCAEKMSVYSYCKPAAFVNFSISVLKISYIHLHKL